MRKVAIRLLSIVTVGVLATGATLAYFSDTETSVGNTFSAGTLDLTVDDGNENVVKFTYNNMRPGNQPNRSYTLANVGSLNGYLNITEIAVKNYEHGCTDPEVGAGDTTCAELEGELGDVLNIRVMYDYNCNGWYEASDNIIWQGMMSDLPSELLTNEPLNAGDNVCLNGLVNWWNTPDDNLAQGDSVELDLTFSLSQNSL